MNYLEDGSIILDKQISYSGENYTIDPENPKRLIPKFEPCIHRRFNLRILDCGKKTGTWACTQVPGGVSFSICETCTKRVI